MCIHAAVEVAYRHQLHGTKNEIVSELPSEHLSEFMTCYHNKASLPSLPLALQLAFTRIEDKVDCTQCEQPIDFDTTETLLTRALGDIIQWPTPPALKAMFVSSLVFGSGLHCCVRILRRRYEKYCGGQWGWNCFLSDYTVVDSQVIDVGLGPPIKFSVLMDTRSTLLRSLGQSIHRGPNNTSFIPSR